MLQDNANYSVLKIWEFSNENYVIIRIVRYTNVTKTNMLNRHATLHLGDRKILKINF